MTTALALLALFFGCLLLWVAARLQSTQLDLNIEREQRRSVNNLLDRAIDAAKTHAKRRQLAEDERRKIEGQLLAALDVGAKLEKKLLLLEPLEATTATLEARLEHQRAELKMVHAELTDAHQLVDAHLGMADRLVDALVRMKHAGFVDASPTRPTFAEDLQHPAQVRPDVSDADQRAWEKVLEAIQERASGNAQLMAVLTADAYNWRKARVPIKEIEARIWNGWDGGDSMTFTQDDVVVPAGQAAGGN